MGNGQFQPSRPMEVEDDDCCFVEKDDDCLKQGIIPAVTINSNVSSISSRAKNGNSNVFCASEVILLRTTFDIIKRNRDQVAIEILERLMVCNEISEKYRKVRGTSNLKSYNWTTLGLGVIILSGIERFILRLGSAEKMKHSIERMVSAHKELGISPKLMVAAMREARTVIMTHIVRNHSYTAPPAVDDYCLDHLQQQQKPPPKFLLRQTSLIGNNINRPAGGAFLVRWLTPKPRSRSFHYGAAAPMCHPNCVTCRSWDNFFNHIDKLLSAAL